MNNFLDLQDINLSINFSVSISPYSTPIGASVRLNQSILYQGILNETWTYSTKLPLLDRVVFSVEVFEKDDQVDCNSAIIIDHLRFDDFDIVPTWTGQAKYENNRSYNSPASHLGFVGVWTLEIPEPFYRWKHRITGQGWLFSPVK